MPLHVSSKSAHRQEAKIVYYTASGIITPIGGRPMHRLREDWIQSSLNLCTGRPPIGVMIPETV